MNKNKSTSLLIATLFGLSLSSTASANTLAFWNDNPQAKVVSRSMDLGENDSPILRASAPGLIKIGDLSKFHLSWESKYKSIVVTAYQTNATTDGINNQGLSAHLLPREAPIPTISPMAQNVINMSLPTVSNLLWVQYVLDNYKTVNEVILGLDQYRITEGMIGNKEVTSHLAVQDATGDSAIIEVVNGTVKVFHGKEFNVATNQEGLDLQLNLLTQYTPFGGELPLSGGHDADSRYVRTTAQLRNLPTPTSSNEAVAGIESIIRSNSVPHNNQGTSTRWISTADLTNGIFYFHSMTNPGGVWVDLKRVKLNEGTPMMFFNPNQSYRTGDVSKLFKGQS